MSTSLDSRWENWPRAAEVQVGTAAVHVRLVDGHELSVPFAWFGFLSAGTEAQRRDVVLEGDGEAIYWPALDDSVSVPSLLGLPEIPPPDPSVGLYTVDYLPGEDGWLAEVRGTGFTSFGATLAAARRAVRNVLRRYHGVRSLGGAGIAVADVVHREAASAAP